METTAQTVMIATIFIWCGLIIGISFTEAWLKFRAPDVTLAIGLGIGRIVFSASNILQLCFTLLMLIIAFSIKTAINTGLIIAVSLLLIQTFWLLPTLNKRAQIVIKTGNNTASNWHIYFVVSEVAKLVSLITSGFIYLTQKL